VSEYLWDNSHVPHKGWHDEEVYDANPDNDGTYHTCEMCGNTLVRWVHVMRHEQYWKDLEVGCVCAEKMEDDYERPKDLEQRVQNRSKRKVTWLTSEKWRRSAKGNLCRRLGGERGMLIIMPDQFNDGKWVVVLDSKFHTGYATEDAAKCAAYDMIDPPPKRTTKELQTPVKKPAEESVKEGIGVEFTREQPEELSVPEGVDLQQELVDNALIECDNAVFHTLETTLSDTQLNTMRAEAIDRRIANCWIWQRKEHEKAKGYKASCDFAG